MSTLTSFENAQAMAPEGWTCIDPDNYQYGRKISNGLYEFRELGLSYWPDENEELTAEELAAIWANTEAWVSKTIDLTHYSLAQREDYARTFYGSLAELYASVEEPSATDMEEGHWVLAECIFEQTADYFC